MEITQESLEIVKKLEDNDDAFDKSIELLKAFCNKYQSFVNNNLTVKDEIINNQDIVVELPDEDIFKNDTKVVFGSLYHVFSMAMEEVDDDDSDCEEDKAKFDNMVSYLRYILNNIDEISFSEPLREDLKEAFSNTINYFDECTKSMEEINNSMSSLGDTIDNFSKDMDVYFKLNEMSTRLKENTDLNKEYLEECELFTKDILSKHNKTNVITVITDYHEKAVDYLKMYNEESDKEKQKNIIKLIQISNVLTLQLAVKKKLLELAKKN